MTEFIFALHNNQKIHIQIPDLPEKDNAHRDATDELDKFDDAKIYFISDTTIMNVTKGVFGYLLGQFNILLTKSINKEQLLPNTMQPGNIGYALNQMLYDSNNPRVAYFWLWGSNNHIQTLLYQSNDTMYLEIVPTYPWLFDNTPSGQDSFEQFIKLYKAYVVEIIPHHIALEWLEQSNAILKVIEAPYYFI